jgi:hypothetical protein
MSLKAPGWYSARLTLAIDIKKAFCMWVWWKWEINERKSIKKYDIIVLVWKHKVKECFPRERDGEKESEKLYIKLNNVIKAAGGGDEAVNTFKKENKKVEIKERRQENPFSSRSTSSKRGH